MGPTFMGLQYAWRAPTMVPGEPPRMPGLLPGQPRSGGIPSGAVSAGSNPAGAPFLSLANRRRKSDLGAGLESAVIGQAHPLPGALCRAATCSYDAVVGDMAGVGGGGGGVGVCAAGRGCCGGGGGG